MKLTPLDIHNKEFHRAMRGYQEEEVDKFLDEVAQEYEHIFKENIELKEELEEVKQELKNYSGMGKTLQNTLLTAQKSAEEVIAQAQKQAELTIKEAGLKAKEIVQESHDLNRRYRSTLNHLKQAEEDFRGKFKAMLESYMRIADSTAALADIGSDIPGLGEEPSMEEPSAEEEEVFTMELPRFSMAEVEEEADTQLMSGKYTAEPYIPNNIIPGTRGV
ncbi:MAG TPA: DivIVA domain-containing protein [Anaerolineae bacterium]|jgi:cell division initiation protein|nr:DivIVA domain-containing protein [Anaerolineae bacterium]